MKKRTQQFLYWTPRVVCILFASFLSLFALDVFEGGFGFPKVILALLIHLIPVFLLIISLLVAWRLEWVGAILFVALAVGYVVLSGGRENLIAYIIISGTSLLIGILFLLNWLYRDKLRSR